MRLLPRPHALLAKLRQRRERMDRLSGQVVRAAGLALLYGERYGNYASGREWALLSDLQELHRQAEALQRAIGAAAGASGESQRAALLGLARIHERACERAEPLGSDSRLRRELRRAGRALGKLQTALISAPPSRTSARTAKAWSVSSAAASVATSKARPRTS